MKVQKIGHLEQLNVNATIDSFINSKARRQVQKMGVFYDTESSRCQTIFVFIKQNTCE